MREFACCNERHHDSGAWKWVRNRDPCFTSVIECLKLREPLDQRICLTKRSQKLPLFEYYSRVVTTWPPVWSNSLENIDVDVNKLKRNLFFLVCFWNGSSHIGKNGVFGMPVGAELRTDWCTEGQNLLFGPPKHFLLESIP